MGRRALLLGALAASVVACRGGGADTAAPEATRQRLASEAGATARAVSGVDATRPAEPRGSAVAPATSGVAAAASATPPAGPTATAASPAAASRPVGAASTTPPAPTAASRPVGAASATPPARPTAAAAAPAPAGAAATAAPPSPTPALAFRRERAITYVAIGASDTVGVGAPDPARDGWVPQLHRRLPAGSKLVNLGISGARLRDAVGRELPKALEAKPDLVTVWNVVNDLNANVDLAAYERDLDRLLADLIGKTVARVVIANCPDLARVPAYAKAGIPPDALRQEVGRWNGAIARAVGRQAERVHLVDLYARSGEIDVDPNLVAGDDFHPSAKGYAKIAELFWEFMVAARLVAA